MTDEQIEMDETGELRAQLQFVEHDLQHVVKERDRAKDALDAVATRHQELRQAIAALADDLDRDPTQGRSPAERLRTLIDPETWR